MAQANDLRRSLTAFDPISTLAVVEMRKAKWLVSGAVPGVERRPSLEPGATATSRLIERWRNEEVGAGRPIGRIALVYQARRNGFGLARWLMLDRGTCHPFGKRRAVTRAQAGEVGCGDVDGVFLGLVAR